MVKNAEWLDQISFALLLTFFAIIGSLLVVGGSNLRYLALALLLFFLAFYTAILIHELGHLIAGLRLGYRFKIFAVGMIHVYQDGDQLRFSWRRLAWQPANLLGFTLFEIDYADFRRRLGWLVAAGPLANVLLAVISGLFSLRANGFPSYELYLNNPLSWILSEFNALLFWVSIFLLAMSLYPSAWVSTDGHKLLRLWRSGAILERFKAQMQIASAVLHGIRPRDWPLAWIAALTEAQDDTADTANAHTLAYRWALDRGDERQAEEFLTTAVKLRSVVSPQDRINLLIEAAYVEARYHANANNANQWLKRLGVENKRAQPLLRLRLICAANLIMRQYEKARYNARQAIRAIDRSQATDGITIMERDLFLDIINLCDLADEMQAKRAGTS